VIPARRWLWSGGEIRSDRFNRSVDKCCADKRKVSVIEIRSDRFNPVAHEGGFINESFSDRNQKRPLQLENKIENVNVIQVSMIEIRSDRFNLPEAALSLGLAYSFNDRNQKRPLQLSVIAFLVAIFMVSVIEIRSDRPRQIYHFIIYHLLFSAV